MLSFRLTGDGTGGGYGFVDHFGMSLSIDIVIFVAVRTTRTSVSGVTLCSTGGSSDLAGVAVSQCVGGCGEGESTVGGGIPLVAVCTVFCTGGCFGSGLGIVRGIQLGQGYGSCAVTLGASSGQHTCCRGGGVGSCLVACIVVS